MQSQGQRQDQIQITAAPQCFSFQELQAYYDKHLYGRRNECVLEHIKACDRCLNMLASIQRSRRGLPKPKSHHIPELAARG